MNSKQLTKSIKWYLGYDPGELVKKATAGAGGDAIISAWDVPEDQPTMEQLEQIYNDNLLDESKTKKKAEIKDTAHDIIIAQYPYWKQNNMSHRAIELTDKKHTGSLTSGEQAEETELINAWAWVKDIRDQSDAMESAIDALTTITEIVNYQIVFI